jgi:hypothetical protein
MIPPGLDFVEKKSGHTLGRDTNEKITDGARGLYEKATGYIFLLLFLLPIPYPFPIPKHKHKTPILPEKFPLASGIPT